jgi:hypothetical protein
MAEGAAEAGVITEVAAEEVEPRTVVEEAALTAVEERRTEAAVRTGTRFFQSHPAPSPGAGFFSRSVFDVTLLLATLKWHKCFAE